MQGAGRQVLPVQGGLQKGEIMDSYERELEHSHPDLRHVRVHDPPPQRVVLRRDAKRVSQAGTNQLPEIRQPVQEGEVKYHKENSNISNLVSELRAVPGHTGRDHPPLLLLRRPVAHL